MGFETNYRNLLGKHILFVGPAQQENRGDANKKKKQSRVRDLSWCFSEAVSGHVEEDKKGKETGDKRRIGRKEESKRAIGVT